MEKSNEIISRLNNEQSSTEVYQQYMQQLTDYETKTYIIIPQIFLGQPVFLLEATQYPFLTGWVRELIIEDAVIDEFCISYGHSIVYQIKSPHGNLIPYNVVIPFGLSLYHQSHVVIVPHPSDITHQTIKITITKAVQTPKLINDQLLNIPWGNASLRFAEGMCGISVNNTIDENMLSSRLIGERSQLIDKSGPIMRGSLRVYRLKGTPICVNRHAVKMFLDNQCDLVEFNVVDQPPLPYYDVNERQINYNQTLKRHGDYCTHLQIIFTRPIIGKIQIKLRQNDTVYLPSHITTDHTTYQITDFNDDVVCNILNNHDLQLEVNVFDQSIDILKTLSYQLVAVYGMLKDNYRRQLMLPTTSFTFNINQLSNSYV